jgi:hypothetical protein
VTKRLGGLLRAIPGLGELGVLADGPNHQPDDQRWLLAAFDILAPEARPQRDGDGNTCEAATLPDAFLDSSRAIGRILDFLKQKHSREAVSLTDSDADAPLKYRDVFQVDRKKCRLRIRDT